jgi:hypothetical protein
MTLLDAPQYDPAKERRRNTMIWSIVVAVLVLLVLGWFYRNWPEEHVVDKFFDALQKQDYETAYGLYFHDPNWRQHPQAHPKYGFSDFYQDWGPGGEWGLIKSHKIYGSATSQEGRGVIVEVIVNDRAEHARMFVQKSDKTITLAPF